MDLQCFPYELLDVQLSRISAKLIWIINIYLNMKMAQNPGIYLSQCIISLCVRMDQIMSYINKNILMIWIKGSPQSSNCLKIPSFTQPTLIPSTSLSPAWTPIESKINFPLERKRRASQWNLLSLPSSLSSLQTSPFPFHPRGHRIASKQSWS